MREILYSLSYCIFYAFSSICFSLSAKSLFRTHNFSYIGIVIISTAFEANILLVFSGERFITKRHSCNLIIYGKKKPNTIILLNFQNTKKTPLLNHFLKQLLLYESLFNLLICGCVHIVNSLMKHSSSPSFPINSSEIVQVKKTKVAEISNTLSHFKTTLLFSCLYIANVLFGLKAF